MTETLLDWADVRAALIPMGRGAPYRLSIALAMDHSSLYRKLKGRGQVTARQAEVIREFLAGAPAPAPEPPADRFAFYGRPADDDGERFHINAGSELGRMELPAALAGRGDLILARIPGSHMEPRLFPGEIVVAERGHLPARDRDVLIEFKDGTAMVRTYRGRHDGKVFVAHWRAPGEAIIDTSLIAAIHGVVARL